MKKISSLLVFSRKKAISVFLTIFSVCSYPAQARSRTVGREDTSLEAQSNGKQDDWIQFPYTFQVSPYIGATQKIPQLLAPNDTQKTRQHLSAKGVSIDIGLLQIRRSIYKHFHFYPKLGIAFNYSRLENKGSFMGGSIYLEPQYNHLAKWEMFPRLSLGLVYANIPGTNFKNLPVKEEDNSKALPDAESTQDFYRQGLHWDLSLILVTRINITPHWQLSPSIGLSYLPPFGKEHEEHQEVLEDIPLNSCTLSVALGYTPNPSLIGYSSEKHDKSSRISIGWLSAFKELNSSALGIHTHDLSDYSMEGEGKYYYVGGIYGQWSIPVHSNHALTLATEWILDGVTKQARKDMINSSSLKISILGGHEFRWGKILFGQQLGFYVMNSDGIQASLEEIYFYTRLGLDYKITDFLSLGTSLKTNVLLTRKHEDFIQIDTDFIDFRISYSF